MKVAQIVELLDKISPFELQEEWDNSGLIIGDTDYEIENIYVSIDLDSELLDRVKENSLIILHHPIIFKGIKSLNFKIYPANLIKKAILKNISIIAMHTNYDKTHLNHYVLKEILALDEIDNKEYLSTFRVDMPFDKFVKKVTLAFGLEYIKVVCSKEYIKTASICTGSGASFLSTIKSDCLLTGDIKYHDGVFAKESGISLIDIGHYESEIHFAPSIKKELQNYGLSAIIANSKNPFRYKI